MGEMTPDYPGHVAETILDRLTPGMVEREPATIITWIEEAIREAIQAERDTLRIQMDGLINRLHWVKKERDELLSLSAMLEEHPEEYHGPCLCRGCQVSAQ